MKSSRRFHGWHSSEPIGLEYIGGVLCAKGFQCRFCSNNELVVSLRDASHKLSLFSGVTCEHPLLITLATAAKTRGNVTVVGGYHVSGMQPRDTYDPFDYVVQGEGEEIIAGIADALLHERPVRGADESTDPVIRADRIRDLDSLPRPLRTSERLGKYILFDLIWPPVSAQIGTAIVLTSRGCYHHCDFCASASVWGSGVQFRSPANIVGELEELRDRFNTNTIVIVDQSFGQAKDWTLDVCRAIRHAQLGMNWYHQSNLTLDRDVIRAMAGAGCTKIGFGVEGLSPQAVEIVKPPNPSDFEAINGVLDYCTSLGLITKLYLMIGFPWETEETIKEYFRWLPKLRATQIKVSYMTPFPGTRYWDKYSDQLLTRDWGHFDTVSMPVVHNPSISVDQYHGIRKELFRTFYGSRTYAETTERLLRIRPHYMQSYIEFADYLKTFDMISGDETWLKWLRVPTSKGDRPTEVV